MVKHNSPFCALLLVAAWLRQFLPAVQDSLIVQGIGHRISAGQNRLRKKPRAGVGLAAATAIALLPGVGQTLAQSASEIALLRPNFEVVSIKSNRSRNGASGFSSIPDRLTIIDYTLKDIIAAAYDVRALQVVGGEVWTDSERFDVTALVAISEVERLERLTPEEREEQRRLSLQWLLADRFNLKVSPGTKQVPMYALQISKIGPKLQRTGTGDTLGMGTLGVTGGELRGRGIPISSAREMCLIRMLETQLGRIVIDRTGLEGTYNFTLQWTPDEIQNRSSTFVRRLIYLENGNSLMPDSADSSISTALREQLGLDLQPIVGTVPTIVIDRIEKPS